MTVWGKDGNIPAEMLYNWDFTFIQMRKYTELQTVRTLRVIRKL